MNRCCLALLLCTGLTTYAHASDADDRFKALYTKEWTWRQQQFGGLDDEDKQADPKDDHLPAVGAATH